MKDVFKNTAHARGVDYLMFLKFVVPTLVVEQIQVQQNETRSKKKKKQEDIDAAIEDLNNISKICSIVTQYDISNDDIQELEKLIPLWHNFFRKYLPEERFNINQHYLLHITDIIRDMGSLRKISCRSMEQRIHRFKSRINSTSRTEKNAINVYVNEAYDHYYTRGICDLSNVPDQSINFNNYFKYNAYISKYNQYNLRTLLSRWWGIHKTSVSEDINCAKKVNFSKKRTFDSSLLVSHTKMQINQYALINLGQKSNLVVGKVLLMFEHHYQESKQQFALVHIYQNISATTGGILFGDITERCNQGEINPCSVLELVETNSLALTVATVVSNLKDGIDTIYFFWPEIKRTNLKIGKYDCFQNDNMNFLWDNY